MDINTKIAEELGIRKEQASAAVKLIDEGCTFLLLPGTGKKLPEH